MSLATALLTPILGDASPWGPQRLFQLGEAGAWYDPSDLTAEKVAWRRNLLLNSALNGAVAGTPGTAPTSWALFLSTGSISAVSQYDAGNAQLAFTASASRIAIRQSVTVQEGTRFTFSALCVSNPNGITIGTMMSTGAVPAGTTLDYFFDGVLVNSAVAPTAGQLVEVRLNIGGPSAAVEFRIGIGINGNTTGSVTWARPQVEQSPTATAYQRITDFTSDFLAAFPTHALYQDSAGTTPVTALGQPVGLAIDKSRGGLANLGPELVNIAALPTPSIDDGGSGSTGTWTAGTRTLSNTTTGANNSYPRFRFNFSLTANVRYVVFGRFSGDLAAVRQLRFAGSGASNDIGYSATTGRFYGVQVSAVAYLEVLLNGTLTAPQSVVIEELSIREVPGVHAIQPSSASRPLLDGRVNRLERTEQFDDAYWTKENVTISANAAVAPDGTTTADLLYPSSTGTNRWVRRFTTVTGTSAYQMRIAVKTSGLTWAYVLDVPGTGGAAWINTQTGALGNVAGGYTATSRSLGNGWYELIVLSPVSTGVPMYLPYIGVSDSNGIFSVTASGTSGVLIHGADLRLATDAAYPYQRVAAATDYADVGVPRSFLFDGFDDSLYTAGNMDLSGTDKVTVLTGVRKLSDAGGIIAETSASSSTNPGTFWLAALSAGGAAGAVSSVRSHGTLITAADTPSLPAPATFVFTGLANISADFVVARTNGVAGTPSTADQGTGNYGSYVLFIGRRNNTSSPFNGKAYQLIVRGALTDAATLAQAERYVGAKTGIFL